MAVVELSALTRANLGKEAGQGVGAAGAGR